MKEEVLPRIPNMMRIIRVVAMRMSAVPLKVSGSGGDCWSERRGENVGRNHTKLFGCGDVVKAIFVCRKELEIWI